MQALEHFFSYLNMWGVSKNKRAAENIDKWFYDNDAAINCEDELTVESEKILLVIEQIKDVLSETINLNQEQFHSL